MQNQFCRSCGQENVSSATSCRKCGQLLSPAANNPAGARNVASQPQKSNKMFWIIGGLAVLLIGFVGLAIVVAGGLYFVSQQSGPEVTQNYPKNDSTDNPMTQNTPKDDQTDNQTDKPKDDSDTSGNSLDDFFPKDDADAFNKETKETDTQMNDKILVQYFLQKKAKVGKFRLKSVKTNNKRDAFAGRSAAVRAEYESGGRQLIHMLAVYSSIDKARGDIRAYRQYVRNEGAKIISNKTSAMLYKLKGVHFFAFYNQKGGLHQISAVSLQDIQHYYKNYASGG